MICRRNKLTIFTCLILNNGNIAEISDFHKQGKKWDASDITKEEKEEIKEEKLQLEKTKTKLRLDKT